MRYCCVAIAALVLIAPTYAAHGDTLAVTYTNGGVTFTFDIPSSPTPSRFKTGDSFEVDNVTATGSFGTQTLNVAFYDEGGSTSDGGFGFMTYGFEDIFSGPQVFEGSDSAPTLLTGTFDLKSRDGTATLAIVDTSTVPEPSALVLLGTGIFGLAATSRRKFYPHMRAVKALKFH